MVRPCRDGSYLLIFFFSRFSGPARSLFRSRTFKKPILQISFIPQGLGIIYGDNFRVPDSYVFVWDSSGGGLLGPDGGKSVIGYSVDCLKRYKVPRHKNHVRIHIRSAKCWTSLSCGLSTRRGMHKSFPVRYASPFPCREAQNSVEAASVKCGSVTRLPGLQIECIESRLLGVEDWAEYKDEVEDVCLAC